MMNSILEFIGSTAVVLSISCIVLLLFLWLIYVREEYVLFVESISRLVRSTRDLLNIVDTLTKKGVQFISQKESIDTTTPQGKFMLTVFAAMAELERDQIRQRQRV